MAQCPSIHGEIVCLHIDYGTKTAEWHRDRWIVAFLGGFAQAVVQKGAKAEGSMEMSARWRFMRVAWSVIGGAGAGCAG